MAQILLLGDKVQIKVGGISTFETIRWWINQFPGEIYKRVYAATGVNVSEKIQLNKNAIDYLHERLRKSTEVEHQEMYHKIVSRKKHYMERGKYLFKKGK